MSAGKEDLWTRSGVQTLVGWLMERWRRTEARKRPAGAEVLDSAADVEELVRRGLGEWVAQPRRGRRARATGEDLVLTAAGFAWAQERLQSDEAGAAAELAEKQTDAQERPEWDAEWGELKFGGKVVLALKESAFAEREVLAALQAAGWARRIDSPLPPEGRPAGKDWLRQAVRRLNEHQQVLEFRVVEHGQAVLWRPRE